MAIYVEISSGVRKKESQVTCDCSARFLGLPALCGWTGQTRELHQALQEKTRPRGGKEKLLPPNGAGLVGQHSLACVTEVGVGLQEQPLDVNTHNVEEREEVLCAEDGVSKGKGEGGRDDAPAILHHPRPGTPLHRGGLSRSVDDGVSYTDRQTALSLWRLPSPATELGPCEEHCATHLGRRSRFWLSPLSTAGMSLR